MTKHDLQQYSGILVLCFAICSALYVFTAYIDRKADAHYATTHAKINCKEVINELEVARAFKVSDVFKEPSAATIRKTCNLE